MTNLVELENVVIDINKEWDIYLGPNNNRHWSVNGYIPGHVEMNKNYKKQQEMKRRERLVNWYDIDSYTKNYSIYDYDDFLNGIDIAVIDKIKLENQHSNIEDDEALEYVTSNYLILSLSLEYFYAFKYFMLGLK